MGEMKYYDTELPATAVASGINWAASTLQPTVPNATSTLCAPTVGSAINQRIGRRVHVKKITIKGEITVPAQAGQSTGDAAANIRMLLVQDTQTNATQATGDLIIASPTTAALANTVHSFQSLANLGRFRVLKDKLYTMQNPNMANETQAAGGLVQQGLTRSFKMTYKPKSPITVAFNAVNGGTIADVVDNSWCIYALTSSANIAPTISYQARCYYKE